MNRRNYLRSVFSLGGLAITFFSVFKWANINRPLDDNKLWQKKAIIAELVELIIPSSDSPGAKASAVHIYVITVMSNCNNARQQHIFLSGIESLEKYTKSMFGIGFLQCSSRDMHEALQYASNREGSANNLLNKVKSRLWGQPFFSKLRELTVEGYCMSKLGSTQGLAYDYIPGSYEACTIIKQNQKSWATK